MKTTFYVLVCLFLAIIFTQCNKCEQHQVDYLEFSQHDLTINPYSGNELIIFKDVTGDSTSFDQGTRKNSIETQYQRYATSENNGCRGDYVETELNATTFKSANSLWEFSIILTFEYYFKNNDYDKIISFRMSSNQFENNYGNSERDLSYGVDTIFNRIYLNDTAYRFHQSLTLGQKSFNDVYEIKLISQSPVSNELAVILYYSINEGILGFITNHDKNWYFDRKTD